MSSAESNLLSLREVLIRVAVQLKLADILDGYKLFGPDLCGIKNVELELVLVSIVAQRMVSDI